jgi:hypothetical protein
VEDGAALAHPLATLLHSCRASRLLIALP